jgi:hypothetical protein
VSFCFFFLRGFLAASIRWQIAATDIVFFTPRPSRASAAACSFLGVSLMVVTPRKAETLPLSNHFAIIFERGILRHASIHQTCHPESSERKAARLKNSTVSRQRAK